MIKEGQIFEKTMYGKVVVTCVLLKSAEVINTSGRSGEVDLRYLESVKHSRLLAEYQTWNEAVNSKEFADA